MQNQKTKSKPATLEQPTDEGLDETTCSALLAAGFKLYRPRHKVGIKTQDLSNVRDLNKYYRTQTSWWVSPSGEIVSWEQALKSLPNAQEHTTPRNEA